MLPTRSERLFVWAAAAKVDDGARIGTSLSFFTFQDDAEAN